MFTRGIANTHVCVCVCVCTRVKNRTRMANETFFSATTLPIFFSAEFPRKHFFRRRRRLWTVIEACKPPAQLREDKSRSVFVLS